MALRRWPATVPLCSRGTARGTARARGAARARRSASTERARHAHAGEATERGRNAPNQHFLATAVAFQASLRASRCSFGLSPAAGLKRSPLAHCIHLSRTMLSFPPRSSFFGQPVTLDSSWTVVDSLGLDSFGGQEVWTPGRESNTLFAGRVRTGGAFQKPIPRVTVLIRSKLFLPFAEAFCGPLVLKGISRYWTCFSGGKKHMEASSRVVCQAPLHFLLPVPVAGVLSPQARNTPSCYADTCPV